MSRLSIYREDGSGPELTLQDGAAIAARLRAIGVRFERWETNTPLAADASSEAVLAAYAEPVERLTREFGFQSVDVVALHPDHPDRKAFREKFLNEHTHDDFEVRFFVDGRGLFYLHAGAAVYCVLCERGDLISVPARTTHWFDMGERPSFKAIRLFTTPDGWVANFTGSDIASRLPSFDAFVAAAPA